MTRIAIFGVFVLSGAAALIDEIVWSRQLVLVFGNTTQAVSAILTGFFGGMAIGSAVGGRIADRVVRPLRMYGYLEIALFFVVLATPVTFSLIGDLYSGIYPTLERAPLLLALVRLVLAVLALAPATVLMGATLPTLTRHLAQTAELASAFSRLYAANTIGAIAGTALAGFVLIELLGLSGALTMGAAASGLAGVAAIVLSRRTPPEPWIPHTAGAGFTYPTTLTHSHHAWHFSLLGRRVRRARGFRQRPVAGADPAHRSAQALVRRARNLA
jgi:MFS family permease